MSCTQINQVEWVEDSDAYVLARIMRKNSLHNLVPVLQINLASVIRKVIRTSDTTTVLGPTTLVISNVVLDTLSTGNIWTIDTTGFNFIDDIPAAAFPTGGEEYQVEYKFTLTSGEVFWLVFRGVAEAILTS